METTRNFGRCHPTWIRRGYFLVAERNRFPGERSFPFCPDHHAPAFQKPKQPAQVQVLPSAASYLRVPAH